MENFRNKFINVKSFLAIVLVIVSMSIIAFTGIIKTQLTVDKTQPAEKLLASNETLTPELIIKQASSLLGKPYGSTMGGKGANDPYAQYSNNPGLQEASNVSNIDCSGLIYWTLGKLGVTTKGFAYNTPVPVDTYHWLEYANSRGVFYWKEITGDISAQSIYSVNPKYSYKNGSDNDIKVLKANDTITSSLRYYEYMENGKKCELPAGTIVVSDAHLNNAIDHSWITIGNLHTTNPKDVINYLVNIGVDKSLLIEGQTVVDTGNGCQYWRIESAGGKGVYINNGDPSEGSQEGNKKIGHIWAFQLAEEVKGEYKIEIQKFDENKNSIKIDQNVFSVTKNGSKISPLDITNNVVTIEENLDNINIGNVDTYIIKEEQAPKGFIKYDKELKLEVKTELRNGKKIGFVDKFYINNVLQTKVGGSFQYDDGQIEMNYNRDKSFINVKVKDKSAEGKYSLTINKKDTKLNPIKGANFLIEKIEQDTNSFVGSWKPVLTEEFNGSFTADSDKLKIENVETNDILKIEEIGSPKGYQALGKIIVLQVSKSLTDENYVVNNINAYCFDKNDQISNSLLSTEGSNYIGTLNSANNYSLNYNDFTISSSQDLSIINVTVENKKIDLALKKRITKINGIDAIKSSENMNFNESQNRFANQSLKQFLSSNGYETENYTNPSSLSSTTNALYYSNKTPVEVKAGDMVEYAIKIFNEGEVKARARVINDYYGKGLTVENVTYKGQPITYNNDTEHNVLKIAGVACDFINPFDGETISSDEIIVTCRVNDDATGVLTNVAEIVKYETESEVILEDIDSTADNWKSPNGDEDSTFTDKSTQEWRDYATDTPNGWKDSYLAQDEGINGNKGDDDDFEKLIVKGNAKLTIRKVNENNENIDEIKFNIQKNNDEPETDISVNSQTKVIEKEFEISPTERQEVTYKIQEQENDNYVQLLGPIEIKVVSNEGKLAGYYFTYNNNSPRSTKMETESEKTFKCLAENGITLDVKVKLNVNTSSIEVVISNNRKEETDKKLHLFINKLETDYSTISEEGTEFTVLKETPEGDVKLFSGAIQNGLLQIDDDVKTSDKLKTCTYKIFEDKPALNHNNIFGDKYIKLEVELVYGIPTTADAQIYLGDVKQQNDELLDYIDTYLGLNTINGEEVVVIGLDIQNPEVEKKVDLALKKVITQVQVNGEYKDVKASNGFNEKYDRLTNDRVESSDLATPENHDAKYFLNKTPILVNKGSKVKYQIRIYNESNEQPATASEIIDYLPDGLKLAKNGNDYAVYYKDETTPLNSSEYDYNEETNTLKIKCLANKDLIPVYDSENDVLSSDYITVECVVEDNASGILTNMAEISEYKSLDGIISNDIDSQSKNWKNPVDGKSANNEIVDRGAQSWINYVAKNEYEEGVYKNYLGLEDDDDFEKLVVAEAPKKDRVTVTLKKVSKLDNKPLKNVSFKINDSSVTTSTNEQGIIDLGEFDLDVTQGLKVFNIKEVSTNGEYVVINNPIWFALEPALTQKGDTKLAGYFLNTKEARPETGTHVTQIPSEKAFTINITEVDEEGRYVSGNDYNSEVIRESATFNYSVKLTVKVTENSKNPGNYNVELIIENTPPKTLYDLFIKKVDESETALQGVVFKTQSDNMFNSTQNNRLVTDENGNAYVGRYVISEDNYKSVDTIKIKEIETTYKHYLLDNDLYLKVKKGLNSSGTGYEIKNIKLVYGKQDDDNYQETNEGKDIKLDGVKVANSDETVTIKAKVIAVENNEGQRAQRITITIENKQKKFDLCLRKYIKQVQDDEITRWAQNEVDATDLANGESTTARYTNTKDPIVEVHLKDKVTYGIRVYNEGEIGGYAEYVIDDVPEGLEMIIPGDGENNTSKLNADYRWKMFRLAEEGETPELTYNEKDYVETDKPELAVIIGTDYLSKAHGEELIENVENMENPFFIRAFNSETMDTPIGKEIEVEFKVKSTVNPGTIIENKAQIYRHKDENDDETIEDRDSTPGVWEDSPKDDDQDIEKIVVLRDKEYDLALRKFITKVNNKELEESREPVVDCSKLLNGETTAEKIHTKNPVLVKPADIVEYTIRVYNEGKDDAYAETIIDDVPKGTQMIAPEYDENGKPLNMNAEYGWVMYRLATEDEIENIEKESGLRFLSVDKKMYVATDKPEEAVLIVTDYLSYRINPDKNLIKAFNPLNKEMKEENYRDVKVQYSVCDQENIDTQKVLINYAQIGSMADENGNITTKDRDSTPGVWVDEEDDQDIEQLRVGYFDLALYKWVTSAVISEDGKTTEYESKHTQADKSNVVNVSIPQNKLDKVVVKFKYQIKVENEGTIPGKALEITDHLPEGLKFVEEDNKEFKWVQKEDGTIVTDYLKDTVLKPGETAELTVVATWVNDENNLGNKVNYAEISKDENDYGWPDKDSVPGNFKDKPQEDDEDGDEVMLQIRTGSSNVVYIAICLGCLAIIFVGLLFIRRFVIKK